MELTEGSLEQAVASAHAEIDAQHPLVPPLACRWNFHTFIELDPTDAEHDELCKLLGRSRASLNVSGMRGNLDAVCGRCGLIRPSFQRLLVSLRKLRGFGRSK
jgi:hypothetical protein